MDQFLSPPHVSNFNSATSSGFYYWGPSSANQPNSSADPYGILMTIVAFAGNTWVHQLALSNNGRIFYRYNINNEGWSTWKTLHS